MKYVSRQGEAAGQPAKLADIGRYWQKYYHSGFCEAPAERLNCAIWVHEPSLPPSLHGPIRHKWRRSVLFSRLHSNFTVYAILHESKDWMQEEGHLHPLSPGASDHFLTLEPLRNFEWEHAWNSSVCSEETPLVQMSEPRLVWKQTSEHDHHHDDQVMYVVRDKHRTQLLPLTAWPEHPFFQAHGPGSD